MKTRDKPPHPSRSGGLAWAMRGMLRAVRDASMLSVAPLVAMAALQSAPALSKTLLVPSLGSELRQADSVYVAAVTAGQCVEKDCAESAPYVTKYRYSLHCIEVLVGECRDDAELVAAPRLKVGQAYVFVTRSVGSGHRVFAIESRGSPSPEMKLLYDGTYVADGVAIQEATEPPHVQFTYFTYRALKRALRQARTPHGGIEPGGDR